MKFKKLSLENTLDKEWLITNGIGGFASSTIIGANTRKYHGLLVASLMAPGKRKLVLSKIDESIEIGKKKYNLYTNICKNYISEGYKYQTEFEKEFFPKFTYKVEDVEIEKQICMEYGKNTVCISYKINNGKSNIIFNLAPILNFRDYHSMSINKEFKIEQKIDNKKVEIIIDDIKETPIYIYTKEGTYTPFYNNTFNNMYYLEEEKRGFYPEENHIVSGLYNIEIEKNTSREINIICSLEKDIEKIDANKVFDKEKKRLSKIIKETKLIKENNNEELITKLIIASDNFVVKRESTNLATIIAGYPWFLDWGRDTLISFEGLILKQKRYDLAKEILLTITKDIKQGLVPNGYADLDNTPLYNSADSSLLLFEQVKKYLTYTKNYTFIKDNIYEKLKEIVANYENGINIDDNNIYTDNDGLLVSGTETTQNTWMDAKVENMPVTPRNGKTVELNSLWYNALKILEELSEKFSDDKTKNKLEKTSKKLQKAFIKNFYNEKNKCLFDVLGDNKIRPNQLFSISLTYPILNPESIQAKNMFDTVTKKLLNKYGLKSLAKGEKGYIEVYEGNSFRRDMSYHQGITWVWLLGLYNDAFKAIIKAEKNKKEQEKREQEYIKFKQNLEKTFLAEVNKSGTISELYDSKSPYLPKGAISQAWSVAEVLRIITDK